MKKLILYTVIVCFIYSGCTTGEPSKTINFIPLNERKFNFSADSSFAEPQGKIWQERKRFHDSCMGETFAANAIFIKTRDTFRLGTVVNMQTMQPVKDIDLFNPEYTLVRAITFMTKPCYEKNKIDISLTSFVNSEITLSIPGISENINNELTQALHNSVLTEVESGSWFNIEFTDAFGKILDTTTNIQLLEYKKYLLDTSNMVLIKSSSVTDISLYINMAKPMSAQLQKVLTQKPVAVIKNLPFKAQIFFIANSSMQIKFSGIFQVVGQFMQCKLE